MQDAKNKEGPTNFIQASLWCKSIQRNIIGFNAQAYSSEFDATLSLFLMNCKTTEAQHLIRKSQHSSWTKKVEPADFFGSTF